MSRYGRIGVVAVTLAALAACSSPPPPAPPSAPAQPGAGTGGSPTQGGLVITAFHVITDVSCTGQQAAVPAAWATRGAQAVSFEVDGRPLPAAAGYPVSGTGDIPVPCDGAEHAIELVASDGTRTAERTQHVNTSNATPPSGAPTIASFQIHADVTCPGGASVPVAASWSTQNATTVSFAVDGQPLSAAAGYPTTGAGPVPVPCDGRAHKVTLTAANAANQTDSSSRSVNTTPYAPVPPASAPVTPPPLPPTATPPPTPTG